MPSLHSSGRLAATLALVVPLVAYAACGTTDDSASNDAGTTSPRQDASSDSGARLDAADEASPDGAVDEAGASACASAWASVTKLYPDATSLTSCSGVAGAAPIVGSLMNLDGLTIDNNGATETPCIDTRCDALYVYVASNALPHYDFVQTTPNALTASTYIFRVPRTPAAVASTVSAVDTATLTGCDEAYSEYVAGTAGSEASDPSGYCGTGYLYDVLDGGARAYAKSIPCLGTTGAMIDGVPFFGPNEAQVPDAFGNPVYYWPLVAGEAYVPAKLNSGAALDLCGGHTAAAMHFHGANPACFDRDDAGKPKNSYVAATGSWDFGAQLTGDCTAESPIVGWSVDGYAIRGPCACVARNADGSCASVKRARSSWTYRGLGAWSDAGAPALAAEGRSCTSTSDCCGDAATCKYKCSYAIFDDAGAPGGTSPGRSCVLLDYAWCTHHFVDRSTADVSATDFVYLDRCNGRQGPDGYSYYAVMSFPYLTGCYHGEPSSTSAGGAVNPGKPAGGNGPGGHP